jgi:L-lactate dehydrogenase (cytochrome)
MLACDPQLHPEPHTTAHMRLAGPMRGSRCLLLPNHRGIILYLPFSTHIDVCTNLDVSMTSSINRQELAKHASRQSCWLAIHGIVWNVTSFIDSHPGGSALILSQGGRDATSAYDDFHSPELVAETLDADARKGALLSDKIAKDDVPTAGLQHHSAQQQPVATSSLRAMVNLADFEKRASACMTPATWAYITSGADDEISCRENARAYNRVFLRPRVLRDVQTIDCSTTILGHKSSLPVYTSPVGLGKLVHPDGECAIALGAGIEGIIQVVNTVSSIPIERIMESRVNAEQPVFWQLYANRDLSKSAAFVRRVQKAGVKAIWLTVDSPVVGKRERDERLAGSGDTGESMQEIVDSAGAGGVAAANTGFINASIDWNVVEWLRGITDLPIVIKGIQCHEDASLAFQHGVDAIVLSNHGGRSQDTAQPPLLTLLEINRFAPHILGKNMQVFVDGGIRRGTDVIKALALGATAVGIGRPTLFSMAGGFGSYGVRRMIQILRRELQINMAMVGARTIGDLDSSVLNTRRLERLLSRGSCKL